MRIFLLTALLMLAVMAYERYDKQVLVKIQKPDSVTKNLTALIAQPANRIYFIESTTQQLRKDAQLSTVPMVILFHNANDKASLQQEILLQDAGQGWVNSLRFYRVDISKEKDSKTGTTPTVMFVQPDKNGYPILLAASSKLMDRASTFDFLSAGMKAVRSSRPSPAIQHLSDISADQIAEIVSRNNCPVVVLFYEDNSFLSILSEQVLLSCTGKYNQRAIFLRSSDDLVPQLVPGTRPSIGSFKPITGGKVSVESLYGFNDKKRTEQFLDRLPAAWSNP